MFLIEGREYICSLFLYMTRYFLPFLNFALNALVLYRLYSLLAYSFVFEYLILFIFFFFFCMIGIHGIFSGIFTFLDNKNTFNLLFVVQFFTSVLIIQLLGWLFTLYLAFIMMLLYLLWTNQPREYRFFLHACGIVLSGFFLLITAKIL